MRINRTLFVSIVFSILLHILVFALTDFTVMPPTVVTQPNDIVPISLVSTQERQHPTQKPQPRKKIVQDSTRKSFITQRPTPTQLPPQQVNLADPINPSETELPPSLDPTHSSAGIIKTIHPQISRNIPPDYPMFARKHGYEGTVLLKIYVLSNGKPGKIKLLQSSGYNLLDQSALTAVHQWEFFPAQHGNHTIASWVELPIQFRLN